MKSPLKISKTEFTKLYYSKTNKELAKQLNMSTVTLATFLKKNGIILKKNCTKVIFTD
jgi:uncharacterized lipoprotein YmbA